MTDKEIAIKALEKAKMYDNYTARELSFAFDVNVGGEHKDEYTRQMFLSHKFAKAFWGEEKITTNTYSRYDKYGSLGYGGMEIFKLSWKYHLQEMVLETNILKYIEKFLKEK